MIVSSPVCPVEITKWKQHTGHDAYTVIRQLTATSARELFAQSYHTVNHAPDSQTVSLIRLNTTDMWLIINTQSHGKYENDIGTSTKFDPTTPPPVERDRSSAKFE